MNPSLIAKFKRAVLLVLALVVPALVVPALASAAIVTVTSAADAGGACPGTACTLRQAIATAASGGTINFALPANSTINLTSAELLISKNLTINGPGADQLSVQRSTAGGTPLFRIFNIMGNLNVTISGLTIANGNSGGSSGGAIINLSTLTIANSIISGNTAGGTGGGIWNNGGTLTMTDSTIVGNSAGNGFGGGIATEATATITNSTISGNSAGKGFGGGVFILDPGYGGTATITNSTISGNSAVFGGGISAYGKATLINSTITGNSAGKGFAGGGIYIGDKATAIARNTIIALNTAPSGPDVIGGLTSQGYNLIGNTANATITGSTTGNQLNVNPNLGALQDNGGPTWTHALLPGSTAIERGDSGDHKSDQRGFARPVDSPTLPNVGDGSDIGAYEVQAYLLPGCPGINRVVSNNNDSGAGSLREVIATVCAGDTITFAANVRGAITLTSGELLINRNLIIYGPGAKLLSVQRSVSAPNFRIFNVADAFTVTISGLTIANGNAPARNGGGIFNNGGTLRVASSIIVGNTASGGGGGGGIFNNAGTLTMTDNTLAGNSAGFGGGGINNFRGTVAISNSAVTRNTTSSGSGGGIFSSGDVDTGSMTITGSTISGNSATDNIAFVGSGGGISNGGGALSVTNSTIANNTAQFRGGGITNGGALQSRNTIIAGNTAPTGPDFAGALTSQGFNLLGNSSGATVASSEFPDQIGVTAAELNLGPLQDNGGPTETHALLANSRAIDKGESGGASSDQRGLARPADSASIPNAAGGDGADIGAFEVQFGGAVAAAMVVEFYNSALDHYFITWLPAEIAVLDTGTQTKGWVRTSYAFRTYTTPQSGTSPVCRYYIPPGKGDSHFFGRGTTECNDTGTKNPSFQLEDPSFMQLFLPTAGTCPINTIPVYRVFSNRADANHRYMTDRAVRTQMVAAGWLAEGDGSDLVVMCAPQ